jgi:methionyl aminopeptidase
MVVLRTKNEISSLRRAGELVARVLVYGVGHELHEEHHLNHVGIRGRGVRFREGMTLTIGPMINEGTTEIRFLEDGWTVVTADSKLSAQYENTIAVTSRGCEILTPWHLLMRRTAQPPATNESLR